MQLRTDLTYTIYLTALLCAWKLIAFSFGFYGEYYELGRYADIITVLIIIVIVYMGISARRERLSDGYLTFQQAFKTGCFICFVSTLITLAFIYFYYKILNPDYVETIITVIERQLINEGGPDAVSAAVMIVRNDFSATAMMMKQIGINLVAGCLISAIIALILKKDVPHRNGDSYVQ
jgi:hypothetical protein